MSNYLFVGPHKIEFKDSEYKNRIVLVNTNIFINKDCIQEKTKDIPITYKLSSCFECVNDEDAEELARQITEWNANTLCLYRGLSGNHFSYPGLRKGQLISEGNEDYPTFTMSADTKTCWLPTGGSQPTGMMAGVAMGNCDAYTSALTLTEPVFMGLILSIPAGRNSGLRICFLNAGETVVQGPLVVGDYKIHETIWLDGARSSRISWPAALQHNDLPPTRPYQPAAANLITDWWADCQDWVARAAIHNGYLSANCLAIVNAVI